MKPGEARPTAVGDRSNTTRCMVFNFAFFPQSQGRPAQHHPSLPLPTPSHCVIYVMPASALPLWQSLPLRLLSPQALDQMVSSKSLKTLLMLILTAGNFLNQGTQWAASGFRLGSLLKLKDTKTSPAMSEQVVSVEGSTGAKPLKEKPKYGHNLLEVIVMWVASGHSEFLDFHESLSSVAHAARISFSDVHEDLMSLDLQVDVLKQRMVDYPSTFAGQPDGFREVLSTWAEQAEVTLGEIKTAFGEADAMLTHTVQIFGETVDGQRFFKIMSTFIEHWKAAVQKFHKVCSRLDLVIGRDRALACIRLPCTVTSSGRHEVAKRLAQE